MRIALAVFAFWAASPSQAALVIDQQSPGAMCACGDFKSLSVGQSFVAGYNNIAGFGTRFMASNGPATIIYELWDRTPDRVGGLRLVSASIDIDRAYVWADVFWQPVHAEIGREYYVSIWSSNKGYVLGGEDRYEAYAGSAYLDGEIYPGGQLRSRFDFNYRSFSDDSFVLDVPEPDHLAVLLSSCGLMSFAMRRKRNARQLQ